MEYHEDAIRQALELAKSPAGRELVKLLQQQDSSQLRAAAANAASGDLDGAKQALSALLRSPETQRLLRQLGGTHGQNGK